MGFATFPSDGRADIRLTNSRCLLWWPLRLALCRLCPFRLSLRLLDDAISAKWIVVNRNEREVGKVRLIVDGY